MCTVAGGNNVSPQSSFQGAQSPGVTTAVTSKPGTFPVALLQQANATTITTTVAADHNKCSSSGDIITCTYIQETHYTAKDTRGSCNSLSSRCSKKNLRTVFHEYT
jgi:hypothetical protein